MNRIVLERIYSKKIGTYLAFKNSASKHPFKNPMQVCYSIPLLKSDIIADIGAYIGEYSRFCALCHVQKVLSYEATPRTFKVLQENSLPLMYPINKAVIGTHQKSVQLYISPGIGVTNSVVNTKKKGGEITIPSIRYEEAIETATVVKIDTEGCEYFYNIIQPHLRAIILEFHPVKTIQWRELAENIISELQREGFKTAKRPEFKHGWDFNGAWER